MSGTEAYCLRGDKMGGKGYEVQEESPAGKLLIFKKAAIVGEMITAILEEFSAVPWNDLRITVNMSQTLTVRKKLPGEEGIEGDARPAAI